MRLLFQLAIYSIFFLSFVSVQSQSCDLADEDFTGATNNVPPQGWIRGPGTNIGSSVPPDPIQDPAVGMNAVSEFMTSAIYTCAGQVCFDWHASSASSDFTVELTYSEDDVNFIVLDSIVTDGNMSPTTYINICIDLPSSSLPPPFASRIRWQMTRRVTGTFYLENVCVSADTCYVEPTELRFDPIPDFCRQANTPFGVVICATDSNGFVADTFSGEITLFKSSGPGNLSGALVYDAINGCVSISDLSLSMAGVYTLGASSGNLTGMSQAIEIDTACAAEIGLRIMSYNLLNFPTGRDDCGANTAVPSRWDTLEKIVHYYVPDVLMVCELQNQFGADQILNESLNSNGFSNYAAANFVLDQSGGSNELNNMFYYNSEKLTLYSQTEITTNIRDINKYTVFVNDVNLVTTQDTLFIDFYMAHLKAGQDPDDSLKRITACNFLRTHLESFPERNAILGGDLNLYTSSEEAYQILLGGSRPLNDPINTPGNWNENFSFRTTHTQSTRANGTPSLDCGARGGCDSRFDFLLISDPIENESMRLAYIPDSYEALGNDGSIFNKSVTDPGNTSDVPDHILHAIYYMSDHLPVVMELEATLTSPACAEHLILNDDPLFANTYAANVSITSAGRVASPDSVRFEAGTSIDLQSEFTVELGAVFEAVIESCGD